MNLPMTTLSALLLGSAFLFPSTAPGAPLDAWITTKSKASVVRAVGTTAASVDVDTVDGVVTLHGMVPSSADKESAEKAVRNLDGVKQVRNLLEVIPAADREAAAIEAVKIRESIEDALDAEASLADSNIEVASVNAGTVLLSGSAPDPRDQVRALEIARGIEGVTRVESEIVGPEPSATEDILAAAEMAGQRGRSALDTAADASKDAWITSATKARLLADDRVSGLDVDVDTENGVVTLTGTVPDEKAKSAAEAEARRVSGVREIDNRLEVKSEAEEEKSE